LFWAQRSASPGLGREELAEQAKATVESTLGHLAEHITRVEVHLNDENNDKGGSHDKRCMMEARLEGQIGFLDFITALTTA